MSANCRDYDKVLDAHEAASGRFRGIRDMLAYHESKSIHKFNQSGSIENLPRSGRPRKTDERGDRKILRCVKTDRRQVIRKLT